jgi:hypothetical protein
MALTGPLLTGSLTIKEQWFQHHLSIVGLLTYQCEWLVTCLVSKLNGKANRGLSLSVIR